MLRAHDEPGLRGELSFYLTVARPSAAVPVSTTGHQVPTMACNRGSQSASTATSTASCAAARADIICPTSAQVAARSKPGSRSTGLSVSVTERTRESR